MDKYIIDGQELDYEAFKTYVEEQGFTVDNYLASYDVEIVKTEDVADPDATAASTNTAASWESQLANTNSVGKNIVKVNF